MRPSRFITAIFAVGMVGCSEEPEALPARRHGDAGIPSTDAETETRIEDSGLGVLLFRPDTIYTGFDGEHTYQAPIAVYDAPESTVVSTDTSLATIVPAQLDTSGGQGDSGRYFLVTAKKPGSADIEAKTESASATAKIVITEYTAARWKAGRQRYQSGGANGNPPCTQCHGGSSGVDHSPAALASIPDEAVASVITSGISPAGFPMNVDHPSKHRWEVADAELDGLVTYLRSLPPRGFVR